MRRVILSALLLATLLARPDVVVAQDGTTDEHRALAGARSLKCSFQWFASTEWSADEPAVKLGKQDFGFQIDGIDHSRRTTRIIGNAGADDLTVFQGRDSVTFVELVPAGTPNVTSVYAWRDPMGQFKAVHWRHVAIGILVPGTSLGGPAPSQNYGFCQVWQ